MIELGRNLRESPVPRDDVAAVLLALLDAPNSGAVLEMVGGATPVDRALASIR